MSSGSKHLSFAAWLQSLVRLKACRAVTAHNNRHIVSKLWEHEAVWFLQLATWQLEWFKKDNLIGLLCVSCMCCVKALYFFFGDIIQKIDKYALTAVTLIHIDGCTVNIQKADMCSELGTPGALASDQPMKPQQRGQAGACVCMCMGWGVCVGGVPLLRERLL